MTTIGSRLTRREFHRTRASICTAFLFGLATAVGQTQAILHGNLVTDVTSWLPAALKGTTTSIFAFQSSPKGDLLLLTNDDTLYGKAVGATTFTRLIGKGDTGPNGTVVSIWSVSSGHERAYFRVNWSQKISEGLIAGTNKYSFHWTDWKTVGLYLDSSFSTANLTCGTNPLGTQRDGDFVYQLMARAGGPGALAAISTWRCKYSYYFFDPDGMQGTAIPFLLQTGEVFANFLPTPGTDYEPVEDAQGRLVYLTKGVTTGLVWTGLTRLYRFDPTSGQTELLADNKDPSKYVPGPYPGIDLIDPIPQRGTGAILFPVGLSHNLLHLTGSTFEQIYPPNSPPTKPGTELVSGSGSDGFLWLAASANYTWTPVEGVRLAWDPYSESLPNWPARTRVWGYHAGTAPDDHAAFLALSDTQGVTLNRLFKFNRVVLDGYTQTGRVITINGGSFALAPSFDVLENSSALDPSSFDVTANAIRVRMPQSAPYGDYKFSVRVRHTAGTLTSNELTVTFQAAPAQIAAVAPITGASTTLAPGMLVAITGTNLCGMTVQDMASASTAPLNQPWPTSLGGCTVTADGAAVPLRLAATLLSGLSSRIEAQLPFGIQDGANIVVQRLNPDGTVDTTSAPFPVSVASTAPSLFTDPSSGLAIIEDVTASVAVVSADNPIHAGDTIRVRGIGFGTSDPPSAAGTPPADGTAVNIAANVQAYLKMKSGGSDWSFASLTVREAVYDPTQPGIARLLIDIPPDLVADPGQVYLIIRCGDVYTDDYKTYFGNSQ